MPNPIIARRMYPVVFANQDVPVVFDDTFSEALAGGAVLGTLVNGIPRYGIDSSSHMSMADGNLVVSGGAGAYGFPALVLFWGIKRLADTTFECEITHGTNTTRNFFGFGGPWNETFISHAFITETNGRLYPKVANTNGTDVAYAAATSYRYRIVLKAVGAKYYRSTDGGASWVLLHEDSTITKQGLTCGIWNNAQAFTSAYMKLTAPQQIKRIAVVGDSITSVAGNRNWNYHLIENWTKGFYGWINHAIAGKKIMDAVGGLDAQVTAMATDRANAAFLCLGVNDLNGGDMSALQAKVESNIVTVKSYGTLPIYINAVKCWASVGGAEQDKALIRSAIEAACTAQSTACISTYDCPDYTSADTADGVHPILAGAVKLEAHIRPQVEALL